MTARRTGEVALVGAGPGDPGLLTLRGRDLLARAQVVVYDHLVNPRLLALAPPGARRIYLGKEGGEGGGLQAVINRTLVRHGKLGRRVVRLKGGDPFVFGRGGEEAEALVAAGIPFEVVPGVTSAIAAPSYAGIPITDRRYASSLAVVTGHEDAARTSSRIRWEALARGADTLVILMGMRTLRDNARRLVRGGKPSSTPVALVRWGTTPAQEVLTSTLGRVADEAEARGLKPPCVLVVGGVVRLRDRLRWFDRRPLFGRRIVVTRAREQASTFAAALEARGAEVVECPTIAVRPPVRFAPLDRALKGAHTYDWAIFTSPRAVEVVADRLRRLGLDVRVLHGVRLCAIGPATAEALAERGLHVDWVPSEFRAEGIVRGLGGRVRGARILLARARDAREVLPRELRRRGARVDVVEAYRTVAVRRPPQGLEERFRRGEIDLVTFTSSSTVTNFARLFRVPLAPLLADTHVAVIGPVTAATAESLGLRVHLMPPRYTIPALTEAIVRHFTVSSNRSPTRGPRPLRPSKEHPS